MNFFHVLNKLLELFSVVTDYIYRRSSEMNLSSLIKFLFPILLTVIGFTASKTDCFKYKSNQQNFSISNPASLSIAEIFEEESFDPEEESQLDLLTISFIPNSTISSLLSILLILSYFYVLRKSQVFRFTNIPPPCN